MLKNSSIDIEIDGKQAGLPQDDYSLSEITSYDNQDLQYDYFYKEHMMKNLPCIIKNIASDWQCTDLWVKNNTINYEYLITEFGDLNAPVADCEKINFNAQCKFDMKVKDYMNYMRNDRKEKLLYLKDWHLKKNACTNKFYEVPKIFASDWLNEFAIDNGDDDFMFVYVGPKDTWTPFHADVYTSYSWSVNVIGRKRWVLLPPGEEAKLKDSLGNLPLLFDPKCYENVTYFEIIQEKGDGVFVPSGWHHQVLNLFDTVSINHNYINACNIEVVWNSLQNTLISVENEIEEFRHTSEFATQCQLILKSIFGMDFEAFIKLIMYITKKRIRYLKGDIFLLFNTYYLKENHIYFDLHQLKHIIDLVLNHPLCINNTLPNNIVKKLFETKSSLDKVLHKCS